MKQSKVETSFQNLIDGINNDDIDKNISFGDLFNDNGRNDSLLDISSQEFSEIINEDEIGPLKLNFDIPISELMNKLSFFAPSQIHISQNELFEPLYQPSLDFSELDCR